MRLDKALLLGCIISLTATAAEDPLAAVYSRIDRAAVTFKWMTADVQKTAYTAMIDESTVETGKIYVLRPKPHDLKIRFDFQPPDEKQVMIDGAKAEIYYPKTNSKQAVVIDKHTRPMVELLLLLGFGSTSQDLRGGYNIVFGGSETVAGEKTQRIELTPRDKEMLQHVRKIDLWIADSNGLAVQQKFYESGKSYSLALFTHIDLQTRVTDVDVKVKPPKDAHRDPTIGKAK